MKHTLMIATAAASLCLTAMLGSAAETGAKPVDMAAARTKVMAVCQKCHGADGNSEMPMFPRLNAQQPDYIVAQLKNLHLHKRDDTRARGYMWPVARELDPKMMRDLAEYFASQKPTPPQTGGALAAEGEHIFRAGIPDRNIPACQLCHGENGEGLGSVPRIAGQHADYLRMAMGAFRSTLRDEKTMHANTKNISDREIEALASYLGND